MERIGIATDDRRCGNCASCVDNMCWSVDTQYVKVFEHNVCMYFLSKEKFKIMNRQVLKSELINPQKVCGVIASYGSHCYEDACEGMERRCKKLSNVGIRYAYTADGSLLSIFVDDENYVLANETLSKI